MTRTIKILIQQFNFGAFALILFFSFAICGCATTKTGGNATTAQRKFSSPGDALQSLVTALRAHDSRALEDIFGPDSDDLLFSGDLVDDQITEEQFVNEYDDKHQIISNENGSMTIIIGYHDWPMPIPIIKDDSGKAWIFDTLNGKDEVITRRIGRNELAVIEVCKAICDAEREYAQRDPNNDAIPEYARKFISDSGKMNGLYWPTNEGEEPSPLGEFIAGAQGEGYSYTSSQNPSGQPKPYHGYLYRILTTQGKDAPGGAMDYSFDGKLIGGFAVVAWPVNYGSSGIMTFVTNYTGSVYQKDLGEQTDALARAMGEYSPDSTWKKAEQKTKEMTGPSPITPDESSASRPMRSSASAPD